MPGIHFFTGVIPRLDQMLGDLFYRHVQPDVLEKMNYTRLRYWHEWHKILHKEEKKLADDLKGNKGKGKK